jgi:hypothetical protein
MFDQEFSVEGPTSHFSTLDPLQRRDEGVASDSDPRTSDENTTREEPPHPNAGINFAKPTLSRLSQKIIIHPQQTSEEPNLRRRNTPQGFVAQSAPFRAGDDPASTTSLAIFDQQGDENFLSVNHRTTAPASTQADVRRSKYLDVTQHTFYIRNSQRQLKLVAKNEVRLQH